jgi:PAS domain S-box-containing protein
MSFFWSKEFRFRRADETYAYVEENGHIIRDKSGKPIRMVGVLRDITQVKLQSIQKELLSDISKFFKENKDLKSILYDVLKYISNIDAFSNAEIWIKSNDTNELHLVSKFAKDDFAKQFYENTPDVTKVRLGEGISGKTFEKNVPQIWDEIHKANAFVRKNAAKRAGLTSALGLPIYHNNEPIGVLVLMSKLSAFQIENNIEKFAKLQNYLGAEIKRKQKEEEMFLLFESAPEIMAIASPNGYFTKVNPAFCKMLGRTEEEITYTPFETFIHPNDIVDTQLEYKETITGERHSSNFINRYRTKSGNYRWISWSSSDVFDEEGHVFAFGRDVTELIELQHLLENASKLAKVGGWEIDMLQNKHYWSPMTREIHEVPVDFEPDLENAISFYNQQDREIILQKVKNANENGKSYEYEAEILTYKGNKKWVRSIGNPEFLNGKCIRLFGSFQDITETKITELELAQKNEYLLSNTAIILELMNSVDIIKTLENVFGIIGKILNVDRVYFFEIDENETNGVRTFSQRIEWTNDGVPPEINNPQLQNMVFEEYQDYFRQLEKRKIITEVTSNLPENQFKKLIQSQNIKSFMFFPIFVLDRFYGFIGFDDCKTERIWSETEISFLSSVTLHLSTKIQSRILDLQKTKLLDEKNKILESIGDAFFAVDKNWKVTYWNKEAERVLRKKREDIVGKNLWEEYSDDKSLRFYSEYHKAMKSQEIVSFDEFHPNTGLWFEVTAYPVEDGLSVYFKDVSIKKMAEKQIQETNERFEMVTEATNDAIWDFNMENNQLFWGKGFTTLFYYDLTSFEPTFEFLLECIHPEDRSNILAKIQTFLMNDTKSNWFEEYRFLRADGTYAYVIDRAIFLRNKQGRAVRAIGAMTDITYRKEHEDSLNKLNKELEQFAYIASQDLQEPLRMITSFLSQLEKKYHNQLDEKAKMYINYAVDGAKRMRQIILDILEFSRIGKNDDSKEEVDLNVVVDEIILFHSAMIEEKKAQIKVTKLPVIYGHKTHFKQIFQNLIGNALKYSKIDEYPIIQINVEESQDSWEFSVQDNGIGIDSDYYSKIFEIFQRLHVKENYTGTGIGLSIVKKILDNMGGKIWVISQEGKGSTFFFRIPKNETNE